MEPTEGQETDQEVLSPPEQREQVGVWGRSGGVYSSCRRTCVVSEPFMDTRVTFLVGGTGSPKDVPRSGDLSPLDSKVPSGNR